MKSFLKIIFVIIICIGILVMSGMRVKDIHENRNNWRKLINPLKRNKKKQRKKINCSRPEDGNTSNKEIQTERILNE